MMSRMAAAARKIYLIEKPAVFNCTHAYMAMISSRITTGSLMVWADQINIEGNRQSHQPTRTSTHSERKVRAVRYAKTTPSPPKQQFSAAAGRRAGTPLK